MTKEELRSEIIDIVAYGIIDEFNSVAITDQILTLFREDERVRLGCQYGHEKCKVLEMLK